MAFKFLRGEGSERLEEIEAKVQAMLATTGTSSTSRCRRSLGDAVAAT
jgi:hypothetical protein